MKKKIVKIVHIQWEDAYVTIDARDKKNLKSIINQSGPLIDSVGFLVGRNKKKIVLAYSVNQHTADETLEIPRSLVRHTTTLGKIRGSFDWIDESNIA
jgi:hypothetical protein